MVGVPTIYDFGTLFETTVREWQFCSPRKDENERDAHMPSYESFETTSLRSWVSFV